VEPLDLAVGLRPVGLGAEMLDVTVSEQLAQGFVADVSHALSVISLLAWISCSENQARARATNAVVVRAPLVVGGSLWAERKHPATPPHWYLVWLGTDPSAQGNGLASAVLRPVLEHCDTDGVAAYVESSKERNITFYARHGFRVIRELRLPRGPTVWPMWREPRA
jgi:ribosomal protein S18 acetylase RimI-like enzyme